MARKTTKEAAEELMKQFYDEAAEQMLYEIRATRQPSRVAQIKNELDALEKVRDRFYNYLQSGEVAA